ncbi:MAG: polysaccharide biosynthesis tyrosine autokinase [Gemmataceae bacterium]|nr:polysaccharide biosynthesis tyrosine autokinase [Gemmataceae bacterium]
MNPEITTHDSLPAVVPPPPSRSGSVLPPALTNGPNALDLWYALRRRWLLSVGLGLPCAVFFALITWYFLVPARYTATALLHISSTPPRVLGSTGEGSADLPNYQRTQTALLKSRFVLNAALREPKVADLQMVRTRPDAAEWLAKELKVDSTLGPEVLRISLSGDQPGDVAAIVNAIADAYLREIVNKERNGQQTRVDRLKEIYGQYDENLRTRRQTLRKLAEAAGSGDQSTLAVKQRYALEQLALSQRELMELQSQLRRLQVELSTVEARGPVEASLPESFVENQLKNDPAGQQALVRVAALKTDIDRTLKVVVRGEQDPAVQRLRIELTEAERVLADRRKEMQPQLLRLYQEQLEREQLSGKNGLRERRVVLRDLEKVISSDVDRLAQQTRSINKQSLDLESLREEINLSEGIARQIATEVEHLKVELQAPPRVRLLEAAEAPRTKEMKRQLGMTGLAGFAAFACCLGGLTLLEYRARRIHSVDAVVRGLGLNLVGVVPAYPNRLRRATPGVPTLRDLEWQNLLFDSVDAARTMLLHATGPGARKIIMVTSAFSGEGKTSAASQLAQSFARAGLRTLLIDGDLRKPDTHRLFGIGGHRGLSDVLRGDAAIADVIHETPLANLAVMPAGHCDDRTIAMLANTRLSEVLAEAKSRYDFVLIDSAPVLAVADSLLIGRHVDGVVLSTMRHVSCLPAIYEAYERLTALTVPVLGAVVNAVNNSYYGTRYRRPPQSTQVVTVGPEDMDPVASQE